MKIYWSSETGGFYDSRINKVLPDGAVEISVEYREQLIKGMQERRVVVANAEGYPILEDPQPPSAEELAAVERAWRDTELQRVNWLRDRHRDETELGMGTTLDPGLFADLLRYMQSLRDWPQSQKFPIKDHRPLSPTWLEQLGIA